MDNENRIKTLHEGVRLFVRTVIEAGEEPINITKRVSSKFGVHPLVGSAGGWIPGAYFYSQGAQKSFSEGALAFAAWWLLYGAIALKFRERRDRT